VDAAGRIAAVGPDDAVPRPDGARVVDYPDALVLPGLVNVHTHLELHGLRGQVEEADFFSWIQHMRRVRETAPAGSYLEAARAGLRECWSFGVTTLADTGTSGATVQAFAELGGRGVYYQEALGPDRRGAVRAFARVRSSVEALQVEAPAGVAVGVSPHAPYTVGPELLARVVAYALERGLPLAMHLAESQAEVEFVTAGGGPFADSWRERGIPLPRPARSPLAWAAAAGVLGQDLLAIHAVQADLEDVALLAEADAAAAACPRSNRRHGHGELPLAQLLGAGVRVGLGTDSAASVPDMDLLAEARSARELAGLSAEEAVRLATLGGARALGMESQVGSLEAGKWGDFCVLPLEAGVAPDAEQVAGLVLEHREDCLATWVAGRRLHPEPGPGT
jgi:5-methylthioadenosine/S-adenosylhomocysteine deaminase